MKHFYLKSAFVILIIICTLSFALRLVYPDNSNAKNIAAQNELIRTLAKKNVFISSDILDFEKYEVFDIDMKNSMEISALAKQYLGKNATKLNDNSYRSENGVVTLKNFHMTYSPSTPVLKEYTSNIMLSNAGESAKKICEKYNIPISNTQFGISGGKDKITVSVMYTMDSHPVFNNAFALEMSKAGLHSISGTYYTAASVRKNLRYAKRMDKALIEFMQECTDPSRETVITDVQLGYMLNETSAQTTSVSPVWRIIVDNSAIYYVSA